MRDDLREMGLPPAWDVPGGARPLVGRAGELRRLEAVFAGLATGAGRAVAVVGEPGIGKSALLAAAAGRAREAGVPVRTACGPGTGGSAPHGAQPRSVLAEVRALAAGGTPVLVRVDDLHDVAAEDLAAVEQLLQAAGAGPVFCLLAYRPRQLSPAQAEIVSRAAAAGTLEEWNLPPLPPEQAGELLGEHPHAGDVLAEAHGNPLYLKALSHAEESRAQAAAAILGELAGLDPDALAVVEAAAVLGEPFAPELMAAMADLDEAATLRTVDRLTQSDLLRSLEPAPLLGLRHRALAEVVYQRLSPGQRIALHRRAESALARGAAPLASRARHVARAADPRRPEHVTTLIAAARSVLYGSPAEAAGYLRAAVPLLRENQEHWHEAHVLLARARLLAGDTSESRELLDALRSTVSGSAAEAAEAEALPDRSRAERNLGRFSEAGALARAALAALADRDSATAAALHIELADHAYDSQDFAMSRHHAETAAALARRHHDRVGEAQALGQMALALLFTGEEAAAQSAATEAAALVDASSDTVLLTNLYAVVQLGISEGILGRLADVKRHLVRASELARRTGQKHVEQNALTTLANAQARSGDLRDALATLRRSARPDDERNGEPAALAISAILRAEILWWLSGSDDPLGRAEAEAAADRALSIATGSTANWAVTVRCFHAELVLHDGDPARARWLVLDAAGGNELTGITAWRRPRCCDTLAEAAEATGDAAAVAHWARLAERSLRELPSPGRRGFALRARMRAHAVVGNVDAALRCAEEAVADFSVSGERVELCRTLLAAARLSLGAGRVRGVADWLDRAGYLAGQCGSARLAEDVAALRPRLAPAARAAAGASSPLTVREREIAELVSTGLTNRRIAERLFLSVRTVETHLSQIYRKLGVANRASLTRSMLAGAADPAPPPDGR